MPPVSLERPTLADRELVYSWMTMPGIVERMMGPRLSLRSRYRPTASSAQTTARIGGPIASQTPVVSTWLRQTVAVSAASPTTSRSTPWQACWLSKSICGWRAQTYWAAASGAPPSG